MQRDEALRQRVQQRLAAWTRQAHDATQGPVVKPAAVALAIADEGRGARVAGLDRPRAWGAGDGAGEGTGEGEVKGMGAGWSQAAALILTRRAATLRGHAGQWALPGGRCDAGETAEDTARRELLEEVGLDLPPEAVLGRLDDFVTRSGYAITPVVLWAGSAARLQPNPAEVASIHRIRLTEFLREDAPLLEPLAGSEHPVLKMPVGRSWIAAPTAALIYQFREVCLLGRPTRVSHYEQPRFAWR